tara:strand:+ start:16963 stop:18126 length:1164 start_codon:yes stop_codon:yes gene_type:complete
MKIAHYAKILPSKKNSKFLRVGGLESSVINLAKAQAKRHKVALLNSNNALNLKIKKIFYYSITFNLLNIFFGNPLFKFIKVFGKPDIIIIHEIYNFDIVPIILFSKAMRIKVYICPRGTLCPVALEVHKLKKVIYHKIIFQNMVKLINGFIALNKGEKSHIKKLFNKHTIFEIPNGINKDFFYLKKKSVINSKLKNKRIIIGYLGRYDFYIKGLDILLNEYSLYLDKSLKKSIQLVFIGQHRSKHGYSSETIIDNFNKVHKKNPIALNGPFYNKKKYRELLKFDILIQPSRSEGMPNTVLEAMSMGVPIAATKETNILDIIKKSNSGWEINHKLHNISNFFLKLENIKKKKIFNYGLRGYKYSSDKLNIESISDYSFKEDRIRSYKY